MIEVATEMKFDLSGPLKFETVPFGQHLHKRLGILHSERQIVNVYAYILVYITVRLIQMSGLARQGVKPSSRKQSANFSCQRNPDERKP